MIYSHTLRGERHAFDGLRELLACASEEKSGDQLAGIAASSERRRGAAKLALAVVTLGGTAGNPLVEDAVTDALWRDHDATAFAPMRSWTVGQLREWLLEDEGPVLHRAFLPEMASAVAKLMGNKDLVLAASRVRVVTRCRNTMG